MDSNTLEPPSYRFDKTTRSHAIFQVWGFHQKIFLMKIRFHTKNKVCKIVEGKYETGQPDKIKYSKLADGTDYIHSLCNGWKSDVWVKNFFKKQASQDMFLCLRHGRLLN